MPFLLPWIVTLLLPVSLTLLAMYVSALYVVSVISRELTLDRSGVLRKAIFERLAEGWPLALALPFALAQIRVSRAFWLRCVCSSAMIFCFSAGALLLIDWPDVNLQPAAASLIWMHTGVRYLLMFCLVESFLSLLPFCVIAALSHHRVLSAVRAKADRFRRPVMVLRWRPRW